MMYQIANRRALTVEGHMARERALLESIESGGTAGVCTWWETDRPVVVIGRNGRVSDQVIAEACETDGVPVLRRFSGGGAVVLGPGCLSYAVALTFDASPYLVDVAASFRVLLGRVVAALAIPGLRVEGQTDLVLDGRKVSGNAQRRGRRGLIHHGTLLYDFAPGLATRYLKEPARQPAYRAGRHHEAFIGNLPLDAAMVQARLATAWEGLATGGSLP